jgi:nucleolar protein 56
VTAARPARVVTTWFGAFLVEEGAVRAAYLTPKDPGALVDRLRRRREGRLTPEEEQLLLEAKGRGLTGRDRRLEASGVAIRAGSEPEIEPEQYGYASDGIDDILLARAQEDILSGWDPTVHVQEAVRAITDLDGVLNTVGERLASWAAHDHPAEGEPEGVHRHLARELTDTSEAPAYPVPRADPALAGARRELAKLYLSLDRSRSEMESALTEAMPERAPNLTALLGPLLAARLISQAGSLQRLSELPASTIQVLGAERAFFEHLRGRAPPPRHGLLFLHPKLHSAPRLERGRLARALAGKVAIAARLDRAGRPLDPRLLAAFEGRATELDERRARRRSSRERPRRPTSST